MEPINSNKSKNPDTTPVVQSNEIDLEGQNKDTHKKSTYFNILNWRAYSSDKSQVARSNTFSGSPSRWRASLPEMPNIFSSENSSDSKSERRQEKLSRFLEIVEDGLPIYSEYTSSPKISSENDDIIDVVVDNNHFNRNWSDKTIINDKGPQVTDISTEQALEHLNGKEQGTNIDKKYNSYNALDMLREKLPPTPKHAKILLGLEESPSESTSEPRENDLTKNKETHNIKRANVRSQQRKSLDLSRHNSATENRRSTSIRSKKEVEGHDEEFPHSSKDQISPELFTYKNMMDLYAEVKKQAMKKLKIHRMRDIFAIRSDSNSEMKIDEASEKFEVLPKNYFQEVSIVDNKEISPTQEIKEKDDPKRLESGKFYENDDSQSIVESISSKIYDNTLTPMCNIATQTGESLYDVASLAYDYAVLPAYESIATAGYAVSEWYSPRPIGDRRKMDYSSNLDTKSLFEKALIGELEKDKQQIAKIAARDIIIDFSGHNNFFSTDGYLKTLMEERIEGILSDPNETSKHFLISEYLEKGKQLHELSRELYGVEEDKIKPKHLDRQKVKLAKKLEKEIRALANQVEELAKPEESKLIEAALKCYGEKFLNGKQGSKKDREILCALLNIADALDEEKANFYAKDYIREVLDKEYKTACNDLSLISEHAAYRKYLKNLTQLVIDGLEERRNADNRKFGKESLAKILGAFRESLEASRGPWWQRLLSAVAKVIAVTADLTIITRFDTDAVYKDSINPTHL